MEEKKVEYIELIYDLIFVYIVGRNNGLLHTFQNGFIKPGAFLTYGLTTLIVLQIWYYTVLFINRYGENDRIMHIGIFVNMYLLYYMAKGIRTDWEQFYLPFNLAWALILLNITVLYFIRLKRANRAKVWENAQIKASIRVLLIQIVMILVSIPLFYRIHIPLSPLAMFFGILAAIFARNVNNLTALEFNHLTERVMLYVVFTFGEMIIGISGYFEGEITLRTIYFSLCAFLIVTGLFMSYGLFYDHILDRDLMTGGTGYMMIHVFVLLSLNNITTALEFMREEKVAELPKNIFLTGSFVLYFALLLLLTIYAQPERKPDRRTKWLLLGGMLVFVLLMIAFYRNAVISIAVTVVYIAFVSGGLYCRCSRAGW